MSQDSVEYQLRDEVVKDLAEFSTYRFAEVSFPRLAIHYMLLKNELPYALCLVVPINRPNPFGSPLQLSSRPLLNLIKSSKSLETSFKKAFIPYLFLRMKHGDYCVNLTGLEICQTETVITINPKLTTKLDYEARGIVRCLKVFTVWCDSSPKNSAGCTLYNSECDS